MVTSEQQATIGAFIEKHRLKMTVLQVHENPNIQDAVKGSGHYSCKIVGPEGELVTFYTVGPGIIKLKSKLYDRVGQGQAIKMYRPPLSDVMYCLAREAMGLDIGVGFEGWAKDFGYDTDSRRAEAIYNKLHDQATCLYGLLGGEAYLELINDTERL